jgi:hypothetical protein
MGATPIPFWGHSLTTKRIKITAKSFILKDFIRKSFRIKDRGENFLLTL